MKTKAAWGATLFAVFVPCILLSQQAWTIYNQANSGLPFDAVNCIAFDHNGLKWVGTEYGLATFDDVTWTNFNTFNSGLPDNAIRSLAVDSANRLWIGTFLGGLTCFDGSSWTVYNMNNSGLPDDYIKSLAFDTSGILWIGTIMGLVKFDGTNWEVYDINNAPFELSDNIADIQIDSNNVIRLGTLNGGFVKIEWPNWTVYTIPNGSGIPDNTQYEVAVDRFGVEWLATPANGLVGHPGGVSWLIYNPFTSNMPTSATRCLEILTNPDRIWVGTYNAGIVLKSGISFTSYNPSNSPFPDYFACFIESDPNGILWIGTSSGGLVRLDESLLTGMGEEKFLAGYPFVYPTVVNDVCNILSTDCKIISVDITSLAGNKFMSQNSTATVNISKVDFSKAAPGIYLMKLIADDGRTFVKKILKQKF